MLEQKELSFKVHHNGLMVTPRWVPVKTFDEVNCPKCGRMMVVIYGYEKILYAVCKGCHQYFLPAE